MEDPKCQPRCRGEKLALSTTTGIFIRRGKKQLKEQVKAGYADAYKNI